MFHNKDDNRAGSDPVECQDTQIQNPNLKLESVLNTSWGDNPSPKPNPTDLKTRRIIQNPILVSLRTLRYPRVSLPHVPSHRHGH